MSDIFVFIDADNIPYYYFNTLNNELNEIKGTLQNIYVYADWSKTEVKNWLEVCKNNSLIPKMATKYNNIKESSDMRLVTDIFDILYTSPNVKTYCIVSSDSDFTHIINKLKSKSKFVYGFGLSSANKTLINSYHSYTSLDLIYNSNEHSIYFNKQNNDLIKNNNLNKDNKKIVRVLPLKKKFKKDFKKLDKHIYNKSCKIIDKLLDSNGDFNSSQLIEKLKKYYPNFDYRYYGYDRTKSFLLDNFKNYKIKIKYDGIWFMN